MRILLIGREGQVATALRERLVDAPGLNLAVLSRPQIDLAEPAGLEEQVAGEEADVIVNAAAHTAVDRAESEPDLAMRINGEAVGAIAAGAARSGAALLHLSTDYVFDGSGEDAWRPDDPTGPLGTYGRSKLAGEQAALAACPRTTIVRTAWVYSPFGANFVKTMLRLARDRDEVGVVADQFGNPTSALDIAAGIVAALPALAGDRAGAHGLFHLAGTGEASWADLAEETFRLAAARGLPAARVRRITTADFPTPARRPANSRLDSSHFAEVFGYRAPPWQEALDRVVDRLAAG